MLKNISFQKKMFIYYSTVLVAIVLVATFSVYYYLYKNLENRAFENLTQITQKASEQVDGFLGSMDNQALQIMANHRVHAMFELINNEPHTTNYFQTSLAISREMEDILASINGPKMTAWRLSVYNSQGDFFSYGRPINDNSVKQSLANPGWIRLLFAQNGSPLYLLPKPDPWSNDKEMNTISVLREIRYDNIRYGIAEVQQPASMLEKIMTFTNLNNVQAYLLDADGEIVYHKMSVTEQMKEQMKGLVQSVAAAHKGTRLESKFSPKEKDVISYKYSEETGWTTLLVQPVNRLLEPAHFLLVIILSIGLLMVLVTLVIIYWITQSLSKPIRQLRVSLKTINLENFQMPLTEYKTNNEIVILNHSFQDMMQRLDESMHQVIESRSREIKSHYLALQSQMNPHFQFNILAVINSAARETDNQKISEICLQSSEMLRYITSGNEPYITFQDEFAHAMNYIKLMKHRYENRFDYVISVDEKLQEIIVPKLILQPLIENSFNHGFNQIKTQWNIEIIGMVTDDSWMVEVMDNGSGFTETALRQIAAKMGDFNTRFSSGNVENDFQIGGLGMMNIYERLKINYGEHLIFHVYNSDQGAAVRIGCSRLTEIMFREKSYD